MTILLIGYTVDTIVEGVWRAAMAVGPGHGSLAPTNQYLTTNSFTTILKNSTSVDKLFLAFIKAEDNWVGANVRYHAWPASGAPAEWPENIRNGFMLDR